ncbi:MAG: hypothetical protein H5T69_19470 [Chloroflexi bacterium]|nr:hypothetical protein [Chloroflexota bacterium]
MPLDLVIIMLGTNDLKYRFSLTAYDIANGAGVLVDMVKASGCGRGSGEFGSGAAPEVLLIAPPPLTRLSEFQHIFYGGVEKSAHFGQEYRRVAEERGCHFLDAGEFLVSSDADGVHFDPEGQITLGRKVAQRVREIFGQTT